MYSVSLEKPRGRFGIFTKKENAGEVDQEGRILNNGVDEIHLNVEEGSLTVTSAGQFPVRIIDHDAAEAPGPRRIHYLFPYDRTANTTSSKVTVSSMVCRYRLVIERI